MRDLAEELRSVPLFLERIGVVRGANDFDLIRHNFPALALSLGRDQLALHLNGGARDQMLHGVVVGQRVLRDNLKIAQTGAVVQFNEGEVLRITPGSHPALHKDSVLGRIARKSVYDSSGCNHRRQFAGRSSFDKTKGNSTAPDNPVMLGFRPTRFMKSKILSAALGCLLMAGYAIAAQSKKEARVTQIIRDVRILPEEAAARTAVLNDRVADNTGVRTGGDSRSELTFADLTITRLGANTIFSFNNAGRNDKLDSGSILLRVPKDSGGGRIRSSAVTVAVTGTTVILESARSGRNKLFVLEGSARISLVKYPKQFQNVHSAQMVDVPPGATTIPPPTNIDLNDLMRNHPLIRDFPPLPSQDLIIAASRQQSPPAAPPPSGPSIFPILPVIGLTGGGLTGGSHGTQQTPPGTHPQPPTKPPKPPRQTGPGTVTGTNKAPPSQPTPPPVITRRGPGKTTVPGTNASTTAKSNSTKATAPKKQVVRKPPPPKNNGPR